MAVKSKKETRQAIAPMMREGARQINADMNDATRQAVFGILTYSSSNDVTAKKRTLYAQAATLPFSLQAPPAGDGFACMRTLIFNENTSFLAELTQKMNALAGKQDPLSQTKHEMLGVLYYIVDQNKYRHPRQNALEWMHHPRVVQLSAGKDAISKLKEHRGLSFGRFLGIDTSTSDKIVDKYALSKIRGDLVGEPAPVVYQKLPAPLEAKGEPSEDIEEPGAPSLKGSEDSTRSTLLVTSSASFFGSSHRRDSQDPYEEYQPEGLPDTQAAFFLAPPQETGEQGSTTDRPLPSAPLMPPPTFGEV